MEPLKEMFNAAYFQDLAAVIHKCYKRFPVENFLNEISVNLESLSLNQRLRRTSEVLKQFLPSDFRKAVKILIDAAPHLKRGYTALVMPDYVGLYGKNDFEVSMEALKYFTRFGSSEFAVREFLKTDLTKTLKVMETWANDDDYHVRRLASEGSRPRLPWSFKLQEIVENPRLTFRILDTLKADPELYVRKSVANHLNDISKDHPGYVVELLDGWKNGDAYTSWIIKHASRTLIKKGHQASLNLFGFEKDVRVEFRDFRLTPKTVKFGESIEISFKILSRKNSVQKLVIDYAIHYVRPSGIGSRKVFKLKELRLEPGQLVQISKKQLFKDFTTRKHHSGIHRVEILINGQRAGENSFRLVV